MSPKKEKMPLKENSRVHKTPRTALAAYFEQSSVIGKRSCPETESDIFDIEQSIFGETTDSKENSLSKRRASNF
jgi:hypothetical protein